MSRILLVEDNPASLELLRYLLLQFGHVVLCAEDGERGLTVARSEVPDIVLCDLRMPKLDGYQLLQALRTDDGLREVVVIAVTAHSMPGDREQALQAGFDGYLTKPINPRTIVADVEAFLAGGRHR